LTSVVFERRLRDDFASSVMPTTDAGARFLMSHMYHLVADYHFKSQVRMAIMVDPDGQDFVSAIVYYERDVCAGRSQHTFDSWGGMALASSALLLKLCHVSAARGLRYSPGYCSRSSSTRCARRSWT